MHLRQSFRRIVIALLIGVSLLAIAWHSGGRKLAERALVSLTKDWVSFEVPANATQLDSLALSRPPGGVTVCNQSSDLLSDLLLRVNGIYVAKLDRLTSHECRTLPLQEFASFTWKKIPATAETRVLKIEAIATVSGRRGYLQKQFAD